MGKRTMGGAHELEGCFFGGPFYLLLFHPKDSENSRHIKRIVKKKKLPAFGAGLELLLL